MPKSMYGSGMMRAKVGSPARRQNSSQPGSGSFAGRTKGSFGRGGGRSRSVGGVVYEDMAGPTQVNNGNYNVVEGKAKKFA